MFKFVFLAVSLTSPGTFCVGCSSSAREFVQANNLQEDGTFSLMAIICPLTRLPKNTYNDIVNEVRGRCTRSNEEYHMSALEKVKHMLLPAFHQYKGQVVVLCVPFLVSEADNILLRLGSVDHTPTESVPLTDSDGGMCFFWRQL